AGQPRQPAQGHPDGLALLRRWRDACRGRAARWQCHPSRANVELRRRGAAPEPEKAASWAEADPAALRTGARSDRPSIRADSADSDLRRLLRARADVRGRAQVLLDDLQLEDRAPRAGRLGFRAQPRDPREAPGPLSGERPARQADAGALLRRSLPGL